MPSRACVSSNLHSGCSVSVAGALLADYGADVLRVERIEGDPYSRAHDPGDRHRQRWCEPLGHAREPAAKRSIAVDLQPNEGASCWISCLQPPTCS